MLRMTIKALRYFSDTHGPFYLLEISGSYLASVLHMLSALLGVNGLLWAFDLVLCRTHSQ